MNTPLLVVPAKAGTHGCDTREVGRIDSTTPPRRPWVPASAGTTVTG
jgi:hypothetical protein